MATLITTLNIQGTNRTTFADMLNAQSGMLPAIQAAGGVVNLNSDFRDQLIPVIVQDTLVTPIAAETNKPSVDPTGRNSRFNMLKWPRFTPITDEDDRNMDPADLVDTAVNSVAGIMPQSIDTYYLDEIVAGANVTEVIFNPANGWASLKGVWDVYTTGTTRLTAGVTTRLGAVELGFATDGENRRMDLTDGVGVPIGNSAAELTVPAGSGGTENNKVLGVYGPWHASHVAAQNGVMVDRMPQASIAGKGPENGYVNWRTEARFGHGNAYSTDNAGAVDGTGFTILTMAP